MKIGRLLKVIGRTAVAGARAAQPYTGGGILGAVVGAILLASDAIDKSGADRKAIALAQLATTYPEADLEKISRSVDLIVAALKLLDEAEPA